MIQFENPSAFILIFAIPLLYIFRHLGIFSKITFPLTFSEWKGKSFSHKDSFLKVIAIFAEILATFSFVFLVISLSNPIIREQEKVFTSRGTDILFVLDTSPSMEARDISLVNGSKTRLEAAKIGIKTLISSQTGASYGLIAMASEAACIVPPTNDIDFFEDRLNSLEAGDFGDGTALGIGLSSAIYHLLASNAPKKCIVLITDGENNAGSVHPETAAELALENEISLYALGIGTKGSVPIEYFDKNSGKIHSGFYESDFSSAPLEILAQKANGMYFGIESMDALSASLSEISTREESIQSFFYRSEDKECYATFLLISLVLFSGAWLIKRLVLSEVV